MTRTGRIAAGRARVVAALAVGLLATSGGCSRVAIQAYHEIRGATADLLLMEPVGTEVFEPVRGVAVDPVTTTLSPSLAPLSLRDAFNTTAARLVSERLQAQYPGGEPTLRIACEIVYFQTKGLLSQAQLLTRVRMYLAGRQVLDGLVRAESASFRAGNESALVEAALDAIAKFLARPEDDAPASEGSTAGSRAE